MEREPNTCLSNALFWIILAGLALLLYYFFGDMVNAFRPSDGGNPLQGLIDSIAGFGDSLADLFSGFWR